MLRLARENPRWGYQRIVGELAGIGQRVSATTVAKILPDAGVSPAGARAELNWRAFLRANAASMIACDLRSPDQIQRRERLGGLINEYVRERDRRIYVTPRGVAVNAVTHISALVLYRACIGRNGELDPSCPRCGGIDSEHWGVDPVSLRGCVEDKGEDEDEN